MSEEVDFTAYTDKQLISFIEAWQDHLDRREYNRKWHETQAYNEGVVVRTCQKNIDRLKEELAGRESELS